MAPERQECFSPDYPVNLRISGRKCLVVGGGLVAERKVSALLESGAEVLLVSPEVTPVLSMLATGGQLTLRKKMFEKMDAEGCFLVFCATDSAQVNERAAVAAKAAGALVNVADAPRLCDFTLPARLQRGGLSIAVSTGGRSPALARELRNELARTYGPEYAAYLEIASRVRCEWQEACDSSADRCGRWREVEGFDPEVLMLLKQGFQEEAEVRFRNVVGCIGTQP